MKIITIGNQKGGVGKTTTVMNLGVALKNLGYNVLLIDFDPQGSLSVYLDNKLENKNTIDKLLENYLYNQDFDFNDYVKISSADNISYIPSSPKLSIIEKQIDNRFSREFVLKEILEMDYFKSYDYILIDTCPSINILMTNSLTASTDILIPVQAQFFTIDSLFLMLDTVSNVKKFVNPSLNILGILPTMVDNTNMSKEVINYISTNYSNKILKTRISRLVEASESTLYKVSLVKMNGKLGNQYIELAKEIENLFEV